MENRIQWSRGELKGRSKAALHMNYWRVVLVTVLLSLLIGSGSIVSGTIQPIMNELNTSSDVFSDRELDNKISSIHKAKESGIFERGEQILNGSYYGGIAFLVIVVIAVIVLSFLAVLSGMLVEIFVINPLYVGAMRFYVRSFDTKPQFRELFYAFENRYRNVTGVMFLRDLYTILWCLLFIVPGIVKSYEYSMIPYLLSENPEMEAKEAFAYSRQMMQGQKWKAFVLDLSFLGWKILSAMTFGILGIFFVEPYSKLTNAALYRRLRGIDQISQNIYYDGMEHDKVQGWYEQPK